MAEWITVFCRRPVDLEPAGMRDVLDDADLETLAEVQLDTPGEGLEPMIADVLRNLRAEPARDAGASIDVHYRAEGRPIQISTASGREAEAQITETMEEFPLEAQEPGVLLLREHLNMCVQVVNIEMDADAAGHLGAVLGGELAYAIAEDGDGLVWFFDRDWVSPADRATTLWSNPD